MSDEDFANSRHTQPVVFPFGGPLGRPVSKLRYALRVAFQEAKDTYRSELRKANLGRQSPQWRIVELEDTCFFDVKGYTAKIVVEQDLTKDQVRSLLPRINRHVRHQTKYSNQIRRKRFGRRPANLVHLFVFDKEKRPRDMWACDCFSYYICRTQWWDGRSFNFTGEWESYDEVVENIKVRWRE